MLDAARLPEPLPYYRQVIDFCAKWGFNAILLRVADDQGSALRFASHPELLTHKHAYTPAELSDLARYAAARGIDLIPELEAFGHTGFITRSPQHSHLRDEHPDGIQLFTGIQPLHPDSMSILADLITEVAAIFPSPYLHLGCDEVNWGGSDYSAALIAARGRSGVWTEYLNQLNALARQAGKEMLIWADHVLVHEPEILSGLSREIILVDWNYWDSDPQRAAPGAHRSLSIAGAAQRALEAGFRLIGAPALTWCRWNLRPGASQLANIDAFAGYYHTLQHPANLGLIVTNWVPSRFLPGAIWDGLAYAGEAMNAELDGRAGFERLVGELFGAPYTTDWADFFYSLYAEMRPRQPCASPNIAAFQSPIWSSLSDLLALQAAAPTAPARPKLAALLRQAERLAQSVQRCPDDFNSLRQSLALLEHIEWRAEPASVAAALAAAGAGESGANPALLLQIAEQDAELLSDYTLAWDGLRFAGCPSKHALLPALSPADQPLYALRLAARFSGGLA